ncbi:MAG: glycerol-3-phosphate 1-O-acyltransferase PlsY [Ruminococcaceae bacterium]|jgi:glycerol-3-phosphate acyltransferase PlsY|nr:glycerol-3-phosphate 1-O-acyltransferase PlsY [Oscillospiraceae bacterium]
MFADKSWAWLLAFAAAYFLGALNGAITVSRFFNNDDVRRHGSGNAGTTNVLRTYGKKEAALTLGFDFLKTVAAILIAEWLVGRFGVAVGGVGATIGHAFPVYYGFKGGKAAVCSAASMLMLDWRIFLIIAAIFFGSFFIKRTASISTLLSAFVFPILTWLFYHHELPEPLAVSYVAFAVYILVFVTWLHRGNIKRLLSGTESSFSGRDKK